MEHQALIESATAIITQALPGCVKPALMFSGGKDSVVLLDVLTILGVKFDIIFHREPFLNHKHDFGERVLRQYHRYSHDWPPSAVSMWEGKSIMAYSNFYEIAGGKLMLPKNILPPEAGEPWLCGLDAFFNRPMGNVEYPWDLVFIGHKSSDEDQIAGKVPLHLDTHETENLRAAFPLRHWSDRDIWDYTERHNLPVDHSRYNAALSKEWPTKHTNPDYFHACIECIDRRKKGMVHCPKTDCEIPSIADQIPYHGDPKLAYYGEQENESLSRSA